MVQTHKTNPNQRPNMVSKEEDKDDGKDSNEINNNDATLVTDQKEEKIKKLYSFDKVEESDSESERTSQQSAVFPEDIHQQRLSQALSDIGEYSSGIVALEAWVINEKRTRLVRPEGAWWRDPSYKPPNHMDEELCMESLRVLEDPTHDNYVEPTSLQPGVGIAGQLWAEKTMKIIQPGQSISAFGSFHGVASSFTGSYRRLMFKIKSKSTHQVPTFLEEALIWRGLNFMASDPDLIPDSRLKIFLDAGIGQVAGVPFELPYSQGILLFFSKADTKMEMLQDMRNVEYLKRSASVIGSILALSEPMIASWEAKQEEIAVAQIEAAKELLSKRDIEGKGDIDNSDNDSSNDINFNTRGNVDKDKPFPDTDIEEGSSIPPNISPYDFSKGHALSCFQLESPSQKDAFRQSYRPSCMMTIRLKLMMLKDKVFDSDRAVQPPPPMVSSEAFWTLIGSFLTLLIVSTIGAAIADAIEHLNGPKRYAFPMGPIGALTTLLFGLTSAPASQPRNTIYGSTIAGCIGMAVGVIPMTYVSLRMSIAGSFSIALMTRLGVTHPPGGALAVILSMHNFDWVAFLLYLVGATIAILIATLINNLNVRRTYPQYWSFLPPCCGKKSKKR
jgi:hypothetical protein